MKESIQFVPFCLLKMIPSIKKFFIKRIRIKPARKHIMGACRHLSKQERFGDRRTWRPPKGSTAELEKDKEREQGMKCPWPAGRGQPAALRMPGAEAHCWLET